MKIIYNTSLHLQNVVEDALDLCSIENGKFEVHYSQFDIRKTIEEVCQIMQFQVSHKGLYLNAIVDMSVPKIIKSDEKRLKQILFNLIGNAIKFTFKGGITVSVKY